MSYNINMINKFSERLLDLRKLKGLSQTELAKNIGVVTQSAIAKWEAGDRTPSLECLIALAEFFGCSIDYLVGLEDD